MNRHDTNVVVGPTMTADNVSKQLFLCQAWAVVNTERLAGSVALHGRGTCTG